LVSYYYSVPSLSTLSKTTALKLIVTSLMLRTLKLDHVIISIAKHIC
jgi:hypothetical protein